MSIERPEPGMYTRVKDEVRVRVLGCAGSSAMASVVVQSSKTYYVQLGNFWRKYRKDEG